MNVFFCTIKKIKRITTAIILGIFILTLVIPHNKIYAEAISSLELTGKWTGYYYNDSGKMNLELNIIEVDDRKVEAIFKFSPSKGNYTGKSGSYYMSGTYTNGKLSLKGNKWINKPNNYIFMHLSGNIKNKLIYSGEAYSGYSIFEPRYEFELKKEIDTQIYYGTEKINLNRIEVLKYYPFSPPSISNNKYNNELYKYYMDNGLYDYIDTYIVDSKKYKAYKIEFQSTDVLTADLNDPKVIYIDSNDNIVTEFELIKKLDIINVVNRKSMFTKNSYSYQSICKNNKKLYDEYNMEIEDRMYYPNLYKESVPYYSKLKSVLGDFYEGNIGLKDIIEMHNSFGLFIFDKEFTGNGLYAKDILLAHLTFSLNILNEIDKTVEKSYKADFKDYKIALKIYNAKKLSEKIHYASKLLLDDLELDNINTTKKFDKWVDKYGEVKEYNLGTWKQEGAIFLSKLEYERYKILPSQKRDIIYKGIEIWGSNFIKENNIDIDSIVNGDNSLTNAIKNTNAKEQLEKSFVGLKKIFKLQNIFEQYNEKVIEYKNPEDSRIGYYNYKSAIEVNKIVGYNQPSEWALDEIVNGVSLYLSVKENRSYQDNLTISDSCDIFVGLYREMYEVNKDILIDTTLNFDDNINYDENILKCRTLGIIKGTGGNEVNPNKKVTREEFAVMTGRFLGIVFQDMNFKDKEWEKEPKDSNSISSWALDIVKFLYSKGILIGDNNNRFNPKANLTIEESLIILNRVNKAYEGSNESLYKDTVPYFVAENLQDDMFEDAFTYNPTLALTSRSFAWDSYANEEGEFSLNTLNYLNFDSHVFWESKTEDSIHKTRVLLGTKKLDKSMGNKTLIALSFRGTQGGEDWESNIKGGLSGLGKDYNTGFLTPRNEFINSSSDIKFNINDEKEKISYRDLLNKARENPNDYIFWVTGHSRGGAIALLYDEFLTERLGIPKRTVNTYLFAPAGAYGKEKLAEFKNSENVYCILNEDDLINMTQSDIYYLRGNKLELSINGDEKLVDRFFNRSRRIYNSLSFFGNYHSKYAYDIVTKAINDVSEVSLLRDGEHNVSISQVGSNDKGNYIEIVTKTKYHLVPEYVDRCLEAKSSWDQEFYGKFYLENDYPIKVIENGESKYIKISNLQNRYSFSKDKLYEILFEYMGTSGGTDVSYCFNSNESSKSRVYFSSTCEFDLNYSEDNEGYRLAYFGPLRFDNFNDNINALKSGLINSYDKELKRILIQVKDNKIIKINQVYRP